MKRNLYCKKCNAEYEMNYISVQKLIFNNQRHWECENCKEQNQNLIKVESLTLFLFLGPCIFPLIAFFKLDSLWGILWMIFLIVIMPWVYDLSYILKNKRESSFFVLEGVSFFIIVMIFSKRLLELSFIENTISSFVFFRGDFVENLAMCFSIFILVYRFIASRKKAQ
nr:hypothetical protein BHI3_19070 [Bacteriovorax sp. HI3]